MLTQRILNEFRGIRVDGLVLDTKLRLVRHPHRLLTVQLKFSCGGFKLFA